MPDKHMDSQSFEDTSSKATSFDVLPHGGITTDFDDKSWNNWLIWIVGIIVSMIPLLATPVGRAFAIGWHFKWFYDIFSNPGVFMISVSMSIAVIFELTARKNNKELALGLKASIIILAALAFSFYSLYRGVSAYSEHRGNEAFDYGYSIAIVGALFLLVTFYCGTCFFIPDKVKSLRERVKVNFIKKRK